MKIFFCLALAAALAGADTAAADEVTSMERAKRIMAVRAAAKRVIEDSRVFLDDPRTRAAMRAMMEREMNANVPANGRVDDSRRLCMDRARDSIRNMLASNVAVAVAEAAEHSPLPFTVADVLANVDSNWTGSADQVADSFAAAHFDGIFRDARQAAVALQRAEAEKKIEYPPFSDLNRELTRLAGAKSALARADFDQVGKWWAAQTMARLPPLFDEVRAALDSNFKQIAGEIASQVERQNAAACRAVSNRADTARYLTAEGIGERITAICRDEMLKSAPPKGGAIPAYDLFAVTDSFIRTNAARLEAEYFSEYIKALDSLPVKSADLTRAILADPAAHRSPRRSAELLAAKIRDETAEWAAEQYVTRKENDQRFRNANVVRHFSGLISQTGALSLAWSGRVNSLLEKPAAEARGKAALEQAVKYFPRLMAAERLDDDIIGQLADGRNFAPFKSMAEVRQAFPKVVSDENETGPLLEETEALAVRRANELNTAAQDAVRGQERCLREMEKSLLPDLEKQVAARKPVADIIASWSAALDARWKEQSARLGSPYSGILPRTSDLLNKTVRQLYDAKMTLNSKKDASDDSSHPAASMKDEEKAQRQQSGGGGGGREEIALTRKSKGTVAADLFFVIRDVDGGRCELALGDDEGAELARIVFNPDNAEAAADNILSAARERVREKFVSKLSLSRGALFGLLPDRRSGLKDLNVYILTRSGRVRFKTVLLVREHIERLIAEWAGESSIPPPRLRWGTGFSGEDLK